MRLKISKDYAGKRLFYHHPRGNYIFRRDEIALKSKFFMKEKT
jgi:hypothetical protein